MRFLGKYGEKFPKSRKQIQSKHSNSSCGGPFRNRRTIVFEDNWRKLFLSKELW